MNNKLFIGDNLSIMRSLPNESIDLIATDIPFNSGRSYSSKNGVEFNDKWSSMEEFRGFMRLRLIEMHRLLKPSGSIYVHLDTSASHYIRIEMDRIFHADNFQNDIIWSYHGNAGSRKRWSKRHDIILMYTKSNKFTFYPQFEPYTRKQLNRYKETDKDGRRFWWNNSKKTGKYKCYMKEGTLIGDTWTDIEILTSQKERTGYPTQKPLALYQRIIKASSNEGDLILDPFAGSGTTLDAAQLLNRNWIGIDQNPNTVDYIKKRFDKYGLLHPNYEVIKFDA